VARQGFHGVLYVQVAQRGIGAEPTQAEEGRTNASISFSIPVHG
jgi:hypothetical protein